MEINDTILIVTLVLTLLNLGLVILALSRLNGLRKDLRTPVIKKFNQDFKRKVDIPKVPENFGKNHRDDKQGRANNQQSSAQNRSRNNLQQNRSPQNRRPAAKTPDVFSNETAPQAPIPPRPVAVSAPAEGRRPLPPRYNDAANELAPQAPAPAIYAANSDDDVGMEFDRSKMAHGRRNVVAKPMIEDDGTEENV
jgi:FtsZ-interacting cell division protein ZipA